MTGTLQAELDAYFQRQVAAHVFSGVVLVARESQVLLEKGYGLGDYLQRRRNHPTCIYKIGSMTKAFVTMAIMMLEERGMLSVDDPVAQYLADFPNGHEVTIHQLMTHTSGLWCYLQNMASPVWPVIDQYHSPEQLFEYVRDRPLDFPPGSQWRYSNSGYLLLGLIIERLSKEPLSEFLRRHIFQPLGLQDTTADSFAGQLSHRMAVGYDHLNGDPPPVARRLHASVAYASGGMMSTASDLYKWDQTLYTERLVSHESLSKIFTPGLGNYGYGWWVDQLLINGELHQNVWNWGTSSGFHGLFSRLIGDQATLIILQNMTSPDLLVPQFPEALLRLRDGALSILFQR